MRLINFPWRLYLLSPFAMTALISGGAYEAGRLVAENGQAPQHVGLASGMVVLTLGGTVLYSKFLDFMCSIHAQETAALARLAAPMAGDTVPEDLTRFDAAAAVAKPYRLVSDDGHYGEFYHFDPATTTPGQLLNLALWVAAGDTRLNINLYTTREEHRLTWPRDDFRVFLAELETQGLAVSGAGHYELTRKGKTFLRELARQSGRPLPRYVPRGVRAKIPLRARMHVRTVGGQNSVSTGTEAA